WRAKRAGWGSCSGARVVTQKMDPHPIPSPQGGGEQTEFAARADPAQRTRTACRPCEKGPAGGSRRGQGEGGNRPAGDGRTPTIITDRSVTSPAYEGGAGANVKQLTLEAS